MLWFAQGFDSSPLPQVPDHITEVFGLVLNPMRGRTEEQRLVVVCDSREELVRWWNGQKTGPYMDGEWRRSYKIDGPLAWFNPPWGPDGYRDGFGNGLVHLKRDGWRMVD